MDASSLFRVLGDGLSIISLALIYSSTQTAWKRIPADASIPMQWGIDGKPTWRAKKALGLLLVPAITTVALFLPTVLGTTRTVVDPMQIIAVFAVRAVVAAALCLANLYFLRKALKTLIEEGVIKE